MKMHTAETPCWIRPLSRMLAAGVLSTSTAWALAQAPMSPHAEGGLNSQQMLDLVRATVEQAAQQVMSSQPGVRVVTEVGELNPSLRLAPCLAAQPYLPPGTRVWGEMRIGLRCTQGPVRWNVYVPATVRVHAPALVAAAALPSGHLLTEADLTVAEAELTAEPGQAVADAQTLVGRALAVALRPGQVLRTQHVRARQWFGPGEPVTVVARGSGFAISAAGVALTAGLDGQSARIRLEGGRVVAATAVANRRAEVAL